MAEDDESKKGQNLEMIVSKLAKEKPSDGLGNLILISGVNIQNLSFPNDRQDMEEVEPDIHQCGKCKQMFVNLENYLRHRASKLCHKKNIEVPDNSDDGGSLHQVPHGVQMEVATSNFKEIECDQQELANRRKHERKGVARKRTYTQQDKSDSGVPNRNHSRIVPLDGLQEIIRPVYTTSASFSNIHAEGYQRNYISESRGPNNNDLYSLMELTKNSGIKEAEKEAVQRHEIAVNGEVDAAFPHTSHHFRTSAMRSSIPVVTSAPALQYPGIENVGGAQKGVKRRYKCDKCDRDFNQRANLRRHQLVHSGEKPFECEQCQRRFQQQGDLKRHMSRHSENTRYECHVCDKKFVRMDPLNLHLKEHEENGEIPEGGVSMVQQANGIEDSQEEGGNVKVLTSPHVCSKCNQTFMEPDELLVHTCADGNITVTSLPMEARMKEDVDNSTDDAIGEGLGSNVADDADHSRTYSSSRSASKGKLTNPHKCPLCNAYYKNVDSLKTHILKHSGEKKYKCDQCPKAFFTSSNLKIHKRIHSGDKPLKCKICFKAFSDPSNFNKHKKSHSKGKTERATAGRKGKGGKTLLVSEISTEEQKIKLEDSKAMDFTSQTREFVQSQYEALLPALGESSAEQEMNEANPSELKQENENSDYLPPFARSPSF